MNLDDTIDELNRERATRALIRDMFREVAIGGMVGAHNFGLLKGELPYGDEQRQDAGEVSDTHIGDYADLLTGFAERWAALGGATPTEPRGNLGELQFTEEEADAIREFLLQHTQAAKDLASETATPDIVINAGGSSGEGLTSCEELLRSYGGGTEILVHQVRSMASGEDEVSVRGKLYVNDGTGDNIPWMPADLNDTFAIGANFLSHEEILDFTLVSEPSPEPEEEPFTLESARKGDQIRITEFKNDLHGTLGEVHTHDGGTDRLPWKSESSPYVYTWDILDYELIERGPAE